MTLILVGGAVAVGEAMTLANVKTVVETVFDENKSKIVKYSISNINTAKYNTLAAKLGIKVEYVTCDEPELPVEERGPTYKWLDVAESDKCQISGYMQYLNDNVSTVLPVGHAFYDVASDHTSLNISDPRIGGSVGGGTDVLVAAKREYELHWKVDLVGVKMIIELKPEVKAEKNNIFQARTKLICANIISHKESVVVLLTDLNSRWVFFWVQEGMRSQISRNCI